MKWTNRSKVVSHVLVCADKIFLEQSQHQIHHQNRSNDRVLAGLAKQSSLRQLPEI